MQKVYKRRGKLTAPRSRNNFPEEPREVEKTEEETKEDETTEEEESETCNSFGLEPKARRGQDETGPTQVTEAAVDQKSVEEGVMQMLAEMDWEIEPVEEREEEKAKEPSITVPVEAGADGQVAEMSAENRTFLLVILGGESYRPLLDSGAMVSLAGSRVIDHYANRLKPSTTAVMSVTGKVNRIVGELKVSLEVGGYLSTLSFKAIREIDHDLILGMDFFENFNVELRPARGLWRAREGGWMSLTRKDKDQKNVVYAECAGISELKDEERTTVEKLVERILNSAQFTPGLTDLTDHHIHVIDPTPMKEKLRRMSPKMLSVAQEEVRKMSAEGIIERSASDYCSAPVILRKRDGGHRSCIDYRPLNKVTKKDAYPLSNMDSILDKLRGRDIYPKST